MTKSGQPEDKRFIIWDPQDGEVSRDIAGLEITSAGLVGLLTEDNVFLTAYAEYPTRLTHRDLQVNGCVQRVRFSLSGSRGEYTVYRVR